METQATPAEQPVEQPKAPNLPPGSSPIDASIVGDFIEIALASDAGRVYLKGLLKGRGLDLRKNWVVGAGPGILVPMENGQNG